MNVIAGVRQLAQALAAPAANPLDDELFQFSWTGLAASIAACGVPLVEGIIAGWSPGRLSLYLGVTAIYLMLTQSHYLLPDTFDLRRRWMWAFLLLSGAAAMALQTISGNDAIQPIAFAVPLVWAGLAYSGPRYTATAALYLGLMVLANWLAGNRTPAALTSPLIGYGMIMVLIYGFTRLYVAQAAAQRRANQLTSDLAQQRDYLARLAEITATLTRDLDLTTVLEKVAEAGRVLASAGQARVWLREEHTEGQDGAGLRLAAAVPRPLAAPAPPDGANSATMLTVPLQVKGETIGLLELSRDNGTAFAAGDTSLLQPFADAAAVAIANARLYEQARLSATLAERNRLARDLHDTIAQGLTAINMQLEAAQKNFERDPARARARLERAHELARGTLEDVRRSVWDLAAPLIGGAALEEEIGAQVQRFSEHTGIATRYHHNGPPPVLDTAAATQVARIVQEALKNVEKHAQAATVDVVSENRDGMLVVVIRDDGVGFAAEQVMGSTSGPGFGLRSLNERARLAGGTLHIESAPGEGTQVTFVMGEA